MPKAESTWTAVPDTSITTFTYSFGAGLAKALAAPCDGGIVVISPPCRADERTFAEIEKRGNVRAFVAPNSFHNMGLAEWKKRFPNAAIFAPAQSIKRIESRTGVSGVKPLSELGGLAGAELEIIDMPHYRTGEALVRVKSGKRIVWYVTDVIMNLPVLPPKFPFRQIFRLTKSAPGLRPNGFANMIMVKDKRSLFRWLRGEIDKAPPDVLLASHGDDVMSGAAARLVEILPA